MVLEQGHEQPVSSPVDGWWARDRRDAARLAVADRCSPSRWRSSSSSCSSTSGWARASRSAGIVLALLGWHGEEPQESEA